MSKAFYAVILSSPSDVAWENIRSSWPEGHLICDPRLAFINAENILTRQVADEIGIGPDIPGIVVQMDYFAGHGSSNLVEWIQKHQNG